MELILVVFAFSLIQSLFGIGLLVFGTPLLLLLGYPFEIVLAHLLPASATISLLQISASPRAADLRRDVLVFCVPGVVIGLLVLITLKQSIVIRPLVGALLLGTALLRLCKIGEGIQHFVRKYSRPGFAIVGLLHGLTNMGGGPLSILVSSLRSEKAGVRANVAFAYFVMATSQLFVLAFVWKKPIPPFALALMAVSGLTYLGAGRHLFAFTTEHAYQRLLTGFIGAFGVSLLVL